MTTTPTSTSTSTSKVIEVAEGWWTIHESRVVLVAIGMLLLTVGATVFANDIPPHQYPAILAWLAGALIVHDVLIGGATFATAVATRRIGVRTGLPFRALVIMQGALGVGAILTLIVLPEILKKAIGTANPTVLPLNYAANLVAALVVLVAAALGTIVLHVMLARRVRRSAAPPTTTHP